MLKVIQLVRPMGIEEEAGKRLGTDEKNFQCHRKELDFTSKAKALPVSKQGSGSSGKSMMRAQEVHWRR